MPDSELTIVPLLEKINNVILNPLIVLLFAIALVVFLWGVFQFIRKADDEEAREEGRKSMMWGVIGMFIMFGVFGIIRILLNSIGVTDLKFPF